ncbi:MAG: TolC family protein [Candidatus Zixiibacteriota bacterium]|nr:MAG: TolC family protein [candidate division Zixibacteria bacterium]
MKSNLLAHLWRLAGLVILPVLLLTTGPASAQEADTSAVYAADDSLLNAYLAEALKNHPDLASMEAMIQAQVARARMAGSWMNPSLMLGAMNVPTSLDFHEEPMTMKTVGFMIQIPFPGKLHYTRKAELARVAATRSQYAQMRLDMIAMVKMAYYELAGLLAVQETLEESRMLAGDMITAARIMASSAMGSQADVLRAQLEYETWAKQLIANRENITEAKSRLAAALGRNSAEDLDEPVSRQALTYHPLPQLETLLAGNLEETPALLAQAAEVEAARAELKRARLSYWPDFDVSFTYGFREYLEDGAGMAGMPVETGRTPLGDMVSLEVRFPIPLFYRSNQRALVKENQAMLQNAEAEYRAGSLELRDEVRQAHARMEAARATYELIAETLLPTAEATFEASLVAYQSGSIPFMSLNEALMQVTMHRMDEAMALADLHMARADVARLLGVMLQPW